MIGLLIRYVLPALVIMGLLAWAGSVVHDNGRTVEREYWQELAIEQDKSAAKALSKAQAEVDEQDHKHQIQITGMINDKSEKIDKLERDLHDSVNRKLYVNTSCPDNNNTLPGTSSDTVKPSTRPARVELSSEITKRLQRSYALAQETVILYETCRGVVKAANVEVIYPDE